MYASEVGMMCGSVGVDPLERSFSARSACPVSRRTIWSLETDGVAMDSLSLSLQRLTGGGPRLNFYFNVGQTNNAVLLGTSIEFESRTALDDEVRSREDREGKEEGEMTRLSAQEQENWMWAGAGVQMTRVGGWFAASQTVSLMLVTHGDFRAVTIIRDLTQY